MTASSRRAFDLRRDLWRVAVVLGALAVLNVAFYLFLNAPRLRALSDLESGRDAGRRTLADVKASCEAMRDRVEQYDRETAELDAFYADSLGTQMERMIKIQQAIREIAQEFRINPETIDYNTTDVEGSNLVRFQITLPLVGGYPNLRHFMNRIETSPFLAVIDSIELAGSREGGAMLSLTIRISTYFRGPDLPKGAKTPAPKGRA